MALRRESFLEDAKKILAGIKPTYGVTGYYVLGTEGKDACTFLDFMRREVKALQEDDVAGRRHFMRKDAPRVTAALGDYLHDAHLYMKAGLPWNSGTLSIRDHFHGSSEVFKNEIYPGTDLEGHCYSLDLARSSSGGHMEPVSVTLDRFYVSAKKNSPFRVARQGSLTVNFKEGMIVSLDDELLSRPHVG